MSNGQSRLGAWAAATRLSNLPTCVSNVLVGLMLGYMGTVRSGTGPARPMASEWRLMGELLVDAGGWLVLLAVACFYMSGMLLNDVVDLELDREEQPDRPLPSGKLSRRSAVVAMGALLIAGLVLVAQVDVPALTRVGLGYRPMVVALLLVAAIVAYNLLHQRWPIAVGLLGVCRSLVYVLAASIFPGYGQTYWLTVAPLALVMGLYVGLVSTAARSELEPALTGRRWTAWTLIPVTLSGALFVVPTDWDKWVWTVVAAAALTVWLIRTERQAARPTGTRAAVMAWLAGICLVDAYFLTLMGKPAFALVAGLCFAATVWGHRRVAGT